MDSREGGKFLRKQRIEIFFHFGVLISFGILTRRDLFYFFGEEFLRKNVLDYFISGACVAIETLENFLVDYSANRLF